MGGVVRSDSKMTARRGRVWLRCASGRVRSEGGGEVADAGAEEGAMGGEVVGLVGLAWALAGGDGLLQAVAGVGGLDRLEDDQRVVLGRDPGLVQQAGRVIHP